MKNVLLQAAMKLNKAYRRKKWWRMTVRTLAILVVFCTTYVLILPALTLQSDTVCGQEEHIHEDACYILQPITAPGCEAPETAAHTHEAGCFDPENVLICLLPEITEHVHTESCMVPTGETERVLACQLQEHIHADACYPLPEEQKNEYHCGLGEHAHIDSCHDEAGALICSIPEHSHEAACIQPVDTNPDADDQSRWKQKLNAVELTGEHTSDIHTLAESQVGYAESGINVVLTADGLRGYTFYSDSYSDGYGEWSLHFVRYMVEKAQVENFPVEDDAADWIAALEAEGLFGAADAYRPRVGDVLFLENDRAAVVAELIPTADGMPDQMKVIQGDVNGAVASVTYTADDPTILGYGMIPDNPLPPEQWRQANVLAALAAQLPDAEQTRQALEALNRQGDKLGFEALRQELISRIEPIQTQYDACNDLQKARAGSLDNLYALQEVCGGASWQTLPKLEDDSALVAELAAGQAEVVAGPDRGTYSQLARDNRTFSVYDGDTLRYPFTVAMESYYKDIAFSEARIKVELVLPLTAEQAVLDAAAMTWLEDSALTHEYRTINGNELLCQVLTGYKRVVTDEHTVKVVSGTFTEEVVVNVLDMGHGQQVAVIISAAMEHGCWNGNCDTHGVEEKLTVVTESFLIYEPLADEQQQAVFQNYQAEIDVLAAQEGQAPIEDLEERIHRSYCLGALSDDHYGDLYQKLLRLAGMDLESIAEPSKGDGWIWLDTSEPGYSTENVVLYSSASISQAPISVAMPAATYSSLGLDSNSQIPENGWGGENSSGDMIWVSKTIEGTEQENVFDITLQIITKEEVNEVYKEPDMAVVVVMDISNTMVSVFSGETTITRYDAAMDAAEQFMKNFAEETDGISKLGYVAFNTHGHEVFPMQQCATTAQATNLAKTMRNKTKKIMDNAAASAGGKYSSSHDRFTNIEAGLKMAADMLEDVNNRHKYIIFLSDGFPTTYLTASSSDGYKGYDPYTDSGTNGKAGVFYDNVMGVHCDYGTSYSDTAAIKARQMAVNLKNDGINIFSIGVDVEGQTIWEYHYDSKTRLKTASTVERSKSTTYYNSTGYEIGTLHKEFANLTSLTAAQKKSMAQDFKDWLKGSKSKGIGSGYYYESTDQDGLEEAYSQIFQQILQINAESSHLDWVATDPMPGMGVHELETIEFIGFWDMWDDNPSLVDALNGESQDNSLYYNTATFDTEKNTISWDLKDSGYQSVSMGNNKNFMCALKYRVRLMNEKDDFVELDIYDTNDVTSLTYRIIEIVDSVTQISDRKTINFPIPKVFGYLAELNFKKVDVFGDPLAGAEFTLTHDTANCGTCRGDGAGHVTLPAYTAVSGADGIVSFKKIPSGHRYVLTETKPPEGYEIVHDHKYYVTVSYDELTVTVTDASGNPLEWTGSIENVIYYTLPNTGGVGTSSFTLGGLLVILAGACGYVIYTGRKRKKGGYSA